MDSPAVGGTPLNLWEVPKKGVRSYWSASSENTPRTDRPTTNERTDELTSQPRTDNANE